MAEYLRWGFAGLAGTFDIFTNGGQVYQTYQCHKEEMAFAKKA